MAGSKQSSKKKPKGKDKPAAKPAKAKAPEKKAAPAKGAAVKAHAKPAAKAPPAPPPPAKGAAKPAPGKPGAPPAKGAAAAVKAAPGAKGPDGAAAAAAPAKPDKPKKSRKAASRRGDYPPGELLLPGGPNGPDEIQYLLRGCAAAERPAMEAGVTEILTKRSLPESERGDWTRYAQGMAERFLTGTIEPLLPIRPTQRRNFPGVVDRAKHRRREIGAFLRGLDLGHTESSHMDSHGEDSLEKLMQWAARLENLAEADEPESADYAQFHRGLDQIENQTEALIVDVENTLRRLRDRVRPQKG